MGLVHVMGAHIPTTIQSGAKSFLSQNSKNVCGRLNSIRFIQQYGNLRANRRHLAAMTP